MSVILDLDLDFFVWPVVRGEVEGRPPASEHSCATPVQVRLFLEQRCGLSLENPIPGRFCETHDEAFDVWKMGIADQTLAHPFEVAHVDGHSDLSFGDPSWSYIMKTVLALPPDQRADPERGYGGLNAGVI